MLVTAFILFFVFLMLGVPIAFSLGLGSVVAIFMDDKISSMLVAQKLFSSINSFSLMAIPFFMLSGELMEAGGISKRLVNIAKAFVGHITGGIGMVDIGTSVLFAGVSGSAAADTAAVGSMLIPSMLKNGYPRGLAAVIQACAGSLGPIIPPSLTMIIYCSLTGLSIGSALAGGLSMAFGCTLRAPHGGIFVLPTIGNPFMYLAAVVAGAAVGCVILGFLKKNVNE